MVSEMTREWTLYVVLVETNKNGTYGSQFYQKKPDLFESSEHVELHLHS